MRKHFIVSEKEIKILEDIKKENDFLENDSAALRYIFSEYERLKNIEKKLVAQNEVVTKEIRTIKTINQSIESISEIMLDAVNTILISNDQSVCYPVSYIESPVVTKSKQYKKDKLADLKQQKDYIKKKSK